MKTQLNIYFFPHKLGGFHRVNYKGGLWTFTLGGCRNLVGGDIIIFWWIDLHSHIFSQIIVQILGGARNFRGDWSPIGGGELYALGGCELPLTPPDYPPMLLGNAWGIPSSKLDCYLSFLGTASQASSSFTGFFHRSYYFTLIFLRNASKRLPLETCSQGFPFSLTWSFQGILIPCSFFCYLRLLLKEFLPFELDSHLSPSSAFRGTCSQGAPTIGTELN